jgi:hypothetical protein
MRKAGGRIPHQLVIVGADADVAARDLEQVARAHGVGHEVVFLGAVPEGAVLR